MTIHDVSHLGNPDAHLARIYATSLERNITLALEAKRWDHAEVFATLHGLLADPPPPYSRHPPLKRAFDSQRDFERGTARRKIILDDM